MDEETFANIGHAGVPVVEDKEEKETPADSQPATKPEKEDPSPQGDTEKKDEITETKENTEVHKDIPFHEHPRFKQLIEEKNTLKADLEKFKDDAEGKLNAIEKDSIEMPKWFSDTYGDDEELWKNYQTGLQEQEERIRENVLSEIDNKTNAERESQNRIVTWRDNEVQRLTEEGKKFDKKELFDVMSKYQPTAVDTDGNTVLSFDRGYELLQITKEATKDKVTPALKKKAAALTGSSSKDTVTDKSFFTPKDFR